MKWFLESQDVGLWDTIQINLYKPIKRNQIGVETDKPNEEQTSDEKKKVILNYKAKFFLTYALSKPEYDKIEECEIAQEI